MTPPQQSANRYDREGTIPTLIGTVLFLLTFSVYNLTLCPTVYWYDSGELISACTNLGIAHPTGYPLYTILGRVFSLLPTGNPAVRVNRMSAFFGALTAVVIYLIIKELLRAIVSTNIGRQKDKRWTRRCEREVPAITASLLFAFSPLFWTQTAIAEVYTLHTLLMALLMLSLFLWARTSTLYSKRSKNRNHSEGKTSSNDSYLYLFSFLLGLSFGHHLTTLLFIPAFFLFIVVTEIKILNRITVLASALIFFLLGLSIDLYLLIRSGLDPVQNWGNPDSWERLKDVITGVEIRTRPTRYTPHSIGEMFTLLKKQFLVPGLLLGAIGIFATIRRRIIHFLFFVLFFVGMILYILRNYDFLEDQYLPVFLVFVLWIGLGVKELLSLLSSTMKKQTFHSRLIISTGVCILILILPFSLLALNYRTADASNQRIAYNYGDQILEHLDPEAIILSEGSNNPLLLSYHKGVEGKRPDVANIYLFLMDFEWYRTQLSERSPDISVPILLDNPILSFIERNVRSRSIYYSPFSKEPHVDIGRLIPRGFLFQIQPERTIPSTGDIREHVRRQNRFYNSLTSPLDHVSKDILAQLHGTMGLYFERIGLFDEALREYTKALRTDSLNPGVHYDLGSLAMGRGHFSEAIGHFEKVLTLEPSNINTRYLLGQCYTQTGDLNQAIEVLERIIRSNPDEFHFNLELGVLYGRTGETNLAIEQFEKGLKLDPNNVDLLFNLGIAEAKSGHLEAAIKHLEHAEKKDPRNVEVARALASSYAQCKEYGKAEYYFQKTLQLGGPNPSVLEDLGYVYRERGDMMKAIEVWESALKLDPDNIRLQRELHRLQEKMKTNETGERKPQ